LTDQADPQVRRALRDALGFPAVDSADPGDVRRPVRSSARARREEPAKATKAPPPLAATADAAPVPDPLPNPPPGGLLEGLTARLDEALERIATMEKALAEARAALDGRVMDDVAEAAARRTSKVVVAALRQEMVVFSERLSDILSSERAQPSRGRARG
jgi:hypothetical protein